MPYGKTNPIVRRCKTKKSKDPGCGKENYHQRANKKDPKKSFWKYCPECKEITEHVSSVSRHSN